MAFNIETEMCQPFLYFRVNVQKPVVRRSDITIHSISLYPLDNAIRFAITYLLVVIYQLNFIQLGSESFLFHAKPQRSAVTNKKDGAQIVPVSHSQCSSLIEKN